MIINPRCRCCTTTTTTTTLDPLGTTTTSTTTTSEPPLSSYSCSLCLEEPVGYYCVDGSTISKEECEGLGGIYQQELCENLTQNFICEEDDCSRAALVNGLIYEGDSAYDNVCPSNGIETPGRPFQIRGGGCSTVDTYLQNNFCNDQITFRSRVNDSNCYSCSSDTDLFLETRLNFFSGIYTQIASVRYQIIPQANVSMTLDTFIDVQGSPARFELNRRLESINGVPVDRAKLQPLYHQQIVPAAGGANSLGQLEITSPCGCGENICTTSTRDYINLASGNCYTFEFDYKALGDVRAHINMSFYDMQEVRVGYGCDPRTYYAKNPSRFTLLQEFFEQAPLLPDEKRYEGWYGIGGCSNSPLEMCNVRSIVDTQDPNDCVPCHLKSNGEIRCSEWRFEDGFWQRQDSGLGTGSAATMVLNLPFLEIDNSIQPPPNRLDPVDGDCLRECKEMCSNKSPEDRHHTASLYKCPTTTTTTSTIEPPCTNKSECKIEIPFNDKYGDNICYIDGEDVSSDSSRLVDGWDNQCGCAGLATNFNSNCGDADFSDLKNILGRPLSKNPTIEQIVKAEFSAQLFQFIRFGTVNEQISIFTEQEWLEILECFLRNEQFTNPEEPGDCLWLTFNCCSTDFDGVGFECRPCGKPKGPYGKCCKQPSALGTDCDGEYKYNKDCDCARDCYDMGPWKYTVDGETKYRDHDYLREDCEHPSHNMSPPCNVGDYYPNQFCTYSTLAPVTLEEPFPTVRALPCDTFLEECVWTNDTGDICTTTTVSPGGGGNATTTPTPAPAATTTTTSTTTTADPEPVTYFCPTCVLDVITNTLQPSCYEVNDCSECGNPDCGTSCNTSNLNCDPTPEE